MCAFIRAIYARCASIGPKAPTLAHPLMTLASPIESHENNPNHDRSNERRGPRSQRTLRRRTGQTQEQESGKNTQRDPNRATQEAIKEHSGRGNTRRIPITKGDPGRKTETMKKRSARTWPRPESQSWHNERSLTAEETSGCNSATMAATASGWQSASQQMCNKFRLSTKRRGCRRRGGGL